MQIDQNPPKANLQTILEALKVKSIEDLFSSEQFNIENIAKTTNHHKLIVYEYLAQIQQIISKPYVLQPQVNIQLDPIFKSWLAEGGEVKEESIKWSLTSNSIVEIIGRSNGGKSYLLNEMIIQCLKVHQKIVYLDSAQNIDKLSYRISQETQHFPEFSSNIWLKRFKFRNLSELSMLLHCIGNEALASKEIYFIFIDSIGRSEEPETENNQANSMEYKFFDKFKRLIIQISQIGGIIFATRCGNANTLFTQAYKTDRHRPKLAGSLSKQWDSIASKTFCVDYARTSDDRQHWSLMSTKSITYCPVTLSRKCK